MAAEQRNVGTESRGGLAAADIGVLKAVFEVVAAGMYVIDLDGVVQLANPGAQALLGYGEEELVGASGHDLFHHLDATGRRRSATHCPIVAVAKSGVARSEDSDVFIRSDGGLLPVAWSSAPILDDGRSVGAIVIFYDITVRMAEDLRHDVELAEARRASEAAAAQAARTAFLADTTAALISTLDVEEALARLARIVVPRFADWCVIDLLEDGRIRRVAIAHREPARVQALGGAVRAEFPLPELSEAALARVLRGAPSVVIRDLAELGGGPTLMEVEQLNLFTRLGASEALIIGLRARKETIGAVVLVRDGRRPFDADERALAEDIGLRAGIAVDNARLFTDTRSTAEALQRSLLPTLPTDGPVALCATYVPAGHGAEVGGDWYDAYVLPGGTTAVVLGDVVGHDLQAATLMGDIRNLLRAASLTDDDPSATLTRLDAAMRQFVPHATATAVFGLVEGAGPTCRFRWSNAGHPPPLLVLADGTSRYLEREADTMLGTVADIARTTHVEPLPAGATVILYSDGLVEDRASGLEPGMARLRRTAARLSAVGRQDVCDHLVDELGREAADDIAILTLTTPA